MAHEITRHDRLVLSKRPAWHGLGKVYPEGHIITPEQAVADTMNWLVGENEVYRLNPETGTYEPISGFKLLRREDLPQSNEDALFDIVPSGYTVIQNQELPEIIKTILGQAGAVVETAGTIKVGRKVWILCKVTSEPNAVVAGDEIERYFLIHNTHDATGALCLLMTPIRVVCQNTLTAAIRGADGSSDMLKLRHTKNIRETLGMVNGILEHSNGQWRRFVNTMQALADKPVSPDFVTAFTETLFPLEEGQKRTTRTLRARETFLNVLANPVGGLTRAVNGTALGVYNATTEYVDTHRGIRVTGVDEDREPTARETGEARMLSVVWGSGATFRQQAFDLLTDPIVADHYQANAKDARKALDKLVLASN